MKHNEAAENAMRGVTKEQDLIFRPDRVDGRVQERLHVLTPANRIEKLRCGGSPWESHYWEDEEANQG